MVDGGLWLRDCEPVSVIRLSSFGKPSWRDRLRASGVDLAVVGGWAGLLAGGSAVWRGMGGGDGGVFRDPATVDVAQFAVMVLPVGLYLAVGEAGAGHATAGKRAAGLVVVEAGGGQPSPLRIAARTGVKLLPWQIAHLSITRVAGIVPGLHSAAWSGAGLVTALGLATASAALAVVRPDGRALHDLIAGTRVVVAAGDAPGFPSVPEGSGAPVSA